VSDGASVMKMMDLRWTEVDKLEQKERSGLRVTFLIKPRMADVFDVERSEMK